MPDENKTPRTCRRSFELGAGEEWATPSALRERPFRAEACGQNLPQRGTRDHLSAHLAFLGILGASLL